MDAARAWRSARAPMRRGTEVGPESPPARFRPAAIPVHVEQLRQPRAQLRARHDQVHLTTAQLELGALEANGKLYVRRGTEVWPESPPARFRPAAIPVHV